MFNKPILTFFYHNENSLTKSNTLSVRLIAQKKPTTNILNYEHNNVHIIYIYYMI